MSGVSVEKKEARKEEAAVGSEERKLDVCCVSCRAVEGDEKGDCEVVVVAIVALAAESLVRISLRGKPLEPLENDAILETLMTPCNAICEQIRKSCR